MSGSAPSDPLWATAYAWMREQMIARFPRHSGLYPVWAWTSPPATREGYGPPGTETVLLEVEVPAERVVLSSFDAWHAVLANAFLSLSEEEADEVEARGPTDDEIRCSWDRVFELDALTEWAVGTTPRTQACVDCIYVHEVRAQTFFVQRAVVLDD